MKTINKYCKDLHSQRSTNLIFRKVMVKLAYASGAPMNSIVNEYNYTENTIKQYCKGLYKDRVFNMLYLPFLILYKCDIETDILEKIYGEKFTTTYWDAQRLLIKDKFFNRYTLIEFICFSSIDELKKWVTNIKLVDLDDILKIFQIFYSNLLNLPKQKLIVSSQKFNNMKLSEKSDILFNEYTAKYNAD